MPRDLQLRAALKAWFAGQLKYKNLREVASSIGIPFDTLRGYFSGKRPNGKNLQLLVELTGLILDPSILPPKSQPNTKAKIYASRLLDELQYDLARYIASITSVQATLKDGVADGKARPSLRAGRQVQSLMDALQRSLEMIVNDPRALELARKVISGSDAGYLSGLLGSLFDDRRLQTWRQMTTYRYGSK